MENSGQSKSVSFESEQKLTVFLGAINRVSPRISTPPEILQVGTPFRDVTNKNKTKRKCISCEFINHFNIFTHFASV